MARTYLDLGVNVLRFNFRGVGQSDGQYGDITGEVQDCQSALKWLTQHQDVKRLFLAGFSFGAYVAAKVAYELKHDYPQLSMEHLLLVAPSVINSPFEHATPLVCPTTVIMGVIGVMVYIRRPSSSTCPKRATFFMVSWCS